MNRRSLVLGIILSWTLFFCPISVFALEGIVGSEIVTLEKCVDGDTAIFKDQEGEIFKTRFLAIDTPETVHPTKKEEAFGKEASKYTCDSLTNAGEIKLEYDGGSDKEDKYGRRLAWVYVDGILLQEKLIELGYAEVAYLYGDYQYTDRLKEKEVHAKENKIGLWSNEKKEKLNTQEEKDQSTTKSVSKKEKKKKNWLQELIDYTLGEIFKYIDKVLEKIAKFIESVL